MLEGKGGAHLRCDEDARPQDGLSGDWFFWRVFLGLRLQQVEFSDCAHSIAFKPFRFLYRQIGQSQHVEQGET